MTETYLKKNLVTRVPTESDGFHADRLELSVKIGPRETNPTDRLDPLTDRMDQSVKKNVIFIFRILFLCVCV